METKILKIRQFSGAETELMKIFITGGTGFVGSSLTKEFTDRGHQVTVLDRTIKVEKEFPSTVSFIEADTTVRGPWQENAAQHELFINLAGASISNSQQFMRH